MARQEGKARAVAEPEAAGKRGKREPTESERYGELGALHAHARDLVSAALTAIKDPEGVILVVDPVLGWLTTHVCDGAFLKKHGVSRIVRLGDEALTGPAKGVLAVFCRPTVPFARELKALAENTRRIHVFSVPQRTLTADLALETLPQTHIEPLPVLAVPLRDDLTSLELPFALRDVFLHGDSAPLNQLARAIVQLESIFGAAPRVLGHGPSVDSLVKILAQTHAALSARSQRAVFPAPSRVDGILVLDRACDLVTPLLLQQTFGGLLDEHSGCAGDLVQMQDDSRPVRLDGLADSLLDEAVRTLSENSAADGHVVGSDRRVSVARALEAFVGSPDTKQTLALEHALLAGSLSSRTAALIEEQVWRSTNLHGALRLLALAQQTVGAASGKSQAGRKQLEAWESALLTAHGYEHVLTVLRLARLGMWDAPLVGAAPFQARAAAWALRPTPPDLLSKPYRGVVPLLVRVAQLALAGHAEPLADEPIAYSPPAWPDSPHVSHLLSLLPGTTHDEPLPVNLPPETLLDNAQPRVTLVAVIGGCTCAELASLRALGRRLAGRRLVLVTTDVLSSARLLQQVCRPF